ncbi:MAG: TolC family protein [Proteobacteria bacterium]|nr:TolC family protein [Pseudomonadota bacterium]
MKKLPLISLITLSITMVGCAVSPQKFTINEIEQIHMDDRNAAMAQVEPYGEVMTINEAIARALKYNLEQRVKKLSQSLASSELELGKYDMLPTLVAKAGYNTRNNYSSRYESTYSDPKNIDRTEDTSVSSEKKHSNFDLGLSWNILDFGASYYTAKQNADKFLIASENRRKSMHTLIRNVRTAYWKALATEKLADRVRDVILASEEALKKSEKLSNERISSPEESLRYQRNLLENLRLLEAIEKELGSARVELTALTGSFPGSTFKLVEPKFNLDVLDIAVEEMEAIALLNNVDLKKGLFNARIAAQDTRKAILKLLPGISLDFGTHRDNDTFLVNESWNSAGLSLSYNLFSILSAPARMSAAEKNEAVAKARRMALQMTVLTQVHLARLQYTNTLKQYKRADRIFSVDSQLEKIAAGKYKGNMAGRQRQISSSVTTILSELRSYQAMSKFQDSIGLLHTTLGLEPEIGSVDDISLTELSDFIGQWMLKGLVVNE